MQNEKMEQDVQDILKNFTGIDPLKELFWNLLNYEKVNLPVRVKDWDEQIKSALSEDPLIFAEGGDQGAFQIIYSRLSPDRLFLTPERLIINRLLKDHPYSLFIFSNKDQERWHFVNVRAAARDEDKSDPLRRRLFRRITISPEERLRTASQRIAMLDLETISADLFGISPFAIQQKHDEAFDVEKVTTEFYESYKIIFNELQKDLRTQTKNHSWAHDYALQFLNRCMFIYFVQRKRWLNNDPDFLNSFWKDYQNSEQKRDSFFDRWLQILFFEAFNNKFDESRHSHIPKPIQTALQNAPYLNGGLFTENELDTRYFKKFSIEDKQFQRIMDFLNRYNFTIREDSPFDQEVAVDAEMLGKVYESLVNVSEEADERGEAGIFYTPRTEIDLMCRISLVDHLTNHLGEKHKSLLYEGIFAYSLDEKQASDEKVEKAGLWKPLESLLQEITVVDPACGSGSFLVGMMMILDDLLNRANISEGRSETPYERRKRIIGDSLYGVDVKGWAVEVAELRLWLQLIVETDIDPKKLKSEPLLPNLSFKIRKGDSLIQEIGGVPMTHHPKWKTAIPQKIRTKLDDLKEKKKRFYQGRPEKDFDTFDKIRNEEFYVFEDILEERERNIASHISTLKITDKGMSDLFRPQSPKTGDVFRNQKIIQLQEEMKEIKKAQDAMKSVKDIPFIWDISFVEIFEGEKKGFDIVIGNPPYVRQEQISNPLIPREKVASENKKEYKTNLIQTVYRTWGEFFGEDPLKPSHKMNAKSDLYIYFYFLTLSLLNPKGSFCFITSNSWLDVGYGSDLQEFLLKQGHVKMIMDNQARRSFAQADVNTIIALLSPPGIKDEGGRIKDEEGRKKDKIARFVQFLVPFEQILSPVIFEEIEAATERKATPEYRIFPITQEKLFLDGCELPEEEQEEKSDKFSGPLIKCARYIGNKWGGKYLRAPDIYWTILEKGKGKLVRLGDIADVRFGIKTGANEFFYLDEERIKEWGIEKEFLKLVIKSPRECKRILIDPKDLKYKIFMCHKEKNELRGTAALEYIKWGEMSRKDEKGREIGKFHERPSCKGRARWWDLGVRRFPPIISPSSVSEIPRTFENSNVFADKRLYEIYPKDTRYHKSILLATNAITCSLFLELGSRTGLGEGLLDLTVYELADCLVVIPTLLKSIDIILKDNRERSFLPLHQEIHHPNRRALDAIIFDALGLTSCEREAVYEAVISLVEARLKKAQSV